MKTRTALSTVLLAVMAFTACSSEDKAADPAACKSAVIGEYRDDPKIVELFGNDDAWPDACRGLEGHEVASIVGQIQGEAMVEDADQYVEDQQENLDRLLDSIPTDGS